MSDRVDVDSRLCLVMGSLEGFGLCLGGRALVFKYWLDIGLMEIDSMDVSFRTKQYLPSLVDLTVTNLSSLSIVFRLLVSQTICVSQYSFPLFLQLVSLQSLYLYTTIWSSTQTFPLLAARPARLTSVPTRRPEESWWVPTCPKNCKPDTESDPCPFARMTKF